MSRACPPGPAAPRVRILWLLGVLVTLLATLVPAALAGAALPGEAPCADDHGLLCSVVAVPLDRSGALPGVVNLAVRRLPASSVPGARTAIIALAGGPGQRAIPVAREFAGELAAGLKDHDLIVFDPRGAGSSGALSCHALSRPGSPLTVARSCANELGPKRGHYTTADSVADIEAIRAAGGYDRITLVGVSYGTKLALEYAAAHPDRVDRLLLDSVLTPNGPDPFMLSTFAAMRRSLTALCSAGRCNGITHAPLSDLSALRRRMNRKSLRGTFVDGRGRRHHVKLNEVDLLSIIRSGDFNPAQRAELPGAVRAALRHDSAPLVRLGLRDAESGDAMSSAPADEPVDNALFLATTCEEAPCPWSRTANVTARFNAAASTADRIPTSSVAPFDRVAAFAGGLVPLCLTWPDAAPAPAPTGALPAVPSLVLEGADDLRTPVEDAAPVAASIGARMVVVPYTGHSVFGSDLSTCATNAVNAFLSSAPVADCGATRDLFPPTPIPPRSVNHLSRAGHVPGRAGRTLRAVALTLVDASDSLIAEALARDTSPKAGMTVGGLRGGSLRVGHTGVALRRYSFVPGVTLSGFIPSKASGVAHLRVAGRAAAGGTVRLSSTAVSGRLGGRRFHLGGAASVHRLDLMPHLRFRAPLLAAIR